MDAGKKVQECRVQRTPEALLTTLPMPMPSDTRHSSSTMIGTIRSPKALSCSRPRPCADK